MATITGFYQDNEGTLIDKDPDAALGYQLLWSEWLSSGDTISTSTWSVEAITGDSDPLTISSESETDTTTTVNVTGGTTGNLYKIYNTIETVGGLTDRRYFRIKVKERTI